MESTQSSLKTKTLVLKVRLAINAACIVNQKADKFICLLLPPTKEEVNAFACVCLSVCLSVSKIIQKRVHGLDEMLRVDRCRDMDELIIF